MPRDSSPDTDTDVTDISAVLAPLVHHWKLLVIAPLAVGVLALAATYLITPTFTARVSFIPPQQQQSSAASAIASLGALAGLAGTAGAIRSPADQYVALLQSVTVQDRLIDRFGLMQVYESDYRFEARRDLAENVKVSLGRRDGLIAVEVDDTSPQRAADLANAHIEELRRLTSTLAVTEAQQRRAFFEQQLQRSKDRLTAAQEALQGSGFNPGALNAEPKAAAERYARLKAEVTAAEVRLQTLGASLSDSAPEILHQRTALAALRSQLARAEQPVQDSSANSYVSRFRDFKYEEALFELFARQYELARVDESREGALIQVIDTAAPPERKSRPRRALTTVVATVASALALLVYVLVRHNWLSRPGRGGPGGALPVRTPDLP